MKVTVPIRQDGRVVIPSPVRQNLGLENGDLVEIDIHTINHSPEAYPQEGGHDG